MNARRTLRAGIVTGLVLVLSACGGGGGSGWNPFKRNPDKATPAAERTPATRAGKKESSIWDLFGNKNDPNVTVKVNKYIWEASLDVLNFLPVESVDPFTGVLVTGYGTPPGGGRAYRATVYVADPALDARSLKVSLQTRSGPASADTVRAVEDAILTRARQLRIRDGNL